MDMGKALEHLLHQCFDLKHARRLADSSFIDPGYLIELCKCEWHKVSNQIEILFVIRGFDGGHTLESCLCFRVKVLLEVNNIRVVSDFL